jgi:hypothetical protein
MLQRQDGTLVQLGLVYCIDTSTIHGHVEAVDTNYC